MRGLIFFSKALRLVLGMTAQALLPNTLKHGTLGLVPLQASLGGI